MMDIEVPKLDVDYDYVLELLITGEIKEHVKDAIISIAQKNVNANLNSSVSAKSTTAASMDENEIYSAMAHLAEDEKRKILDVVKRAQALDQQSASLSSSRRVSIDHVDYQSRTSSRRSSLDRNAPAVCPICVDVEVSQEFIVPDGAMPTNFRQNICSECKKIVCKDCGGFELDSKTKFQVWICSFCSSRRRHMLPTDAYYNSRSDKVQQDIYVDDYYSQLPEYDYYQPQPMLSDRRPSIENYPQEFPPQRFQQVPLTILTPPTPETPRAQRPNFLQISDKEYFGVGSSSCSSSSSTSSQHKQTVLTDSSQHPANHNRAKENINESMTASVASNSSHDPQPLHRLAQHSQSSLESTGSTDGVYRDSHHYPRHEVTNDYYLSEEEELAMISSHQQLRNEDYREEFERVSSPGDESMKLNDVSKSYPFHEWSPPVTDLSPIEDVPSTMELAEEAEWLAYQRNGKRRQGSGESDSSVTSSRSRAKSVQEIGKDSRLRSLSTEIDQMLRNQPLEVLREQSSGEDYPVNGGASLPEHAHEDIFDRDKDSQTSTVESGYESQSKDQQPIPPCPLPRSHFIKDFAEVASEHNSADVVQAAPHGEHTQPVTDCYEDTKARLVDQSSLCDLDLEDDVPVVAEGTTFNIHGGRDMFAKKTDKPQKPPIAKKPSLDVITRTRNFQRQKSNENDSRPTPERSLSTEENRGERPSYRPHSQEGEGQIEAVSNEDKTHLKMEFPTEVLVEEQENLVRSPEGQSILSPSSPSAMSLTNTKPIPAPRRKADNSVRAKPPANINQELDDEIEEIRFDDGDSDLSAPAQRNQIKHTVDSERAGADSSSGGKRNANLRNNGRSISVDLDVRRANIQRSMDELRKREEDENEITKALEKQLNDIRKLEDRQRNILEHTLQQVLQSVNKDPKNASAADQKDEIQIDSRIDCSSLLSPSFNRKTLLNSPLMSHRTTASPQSPRKLSSTGRRQDMQTINENGSYNLTEVAAMSPASSHRTLSSMASPLLQPRSDYGSHAAPSRRTNGGLGDPFTDKNFRLSASYTELPPQIPESADRSGYFSDRETDRRRGGEDLKNYTDEARNAWLQFEIEKRREQVEKNNALRFELQKHIQAQSIPSARYDKLRELYRDHINASREYLGFSSTSLSSLSTGRSMRPGYDGFTTDSEYMSSTEHLAGNLSQSSTIERLKHSSESMYRQVGSNKHGYPPNSRHPHANHTNANNGRNHPDVSPGQRNHSNQQNNEDFSAMPLLDIRAPKSTASSPNSASELVRIGEISRATSDASFGDPEERIIDAKLEGGKTIMRSKEKEATAKGSPSTHAMPASRFNFPTKRVLITPDSASKESGLGLVIKGGQPVPHQHGVHGAFVQQLQSGTVTEQLLGELKPGDEIVEWNGVSLRNRTDAEVQDMIGRSSGEIELTIRLDKQPYKLPRHQRNSDDDDDKSGDEKERVDHERTEPASAGFESPQSDKSWTKEFDEGRQSLGRSRRGTVDTIVSHAEIESVNGQFRRTNRGEMREDQIDQVLQDMGERLEVMNRQPHSPQEEFERDRRLPHQQSSASTIDQDVNSTDTDSNQLFTKMNHSKENRQNSTRLEQQRENSADSVVPGSFVTRSSSDMSTQARVEHNRERIMAEQGTRRMSHQDRLRHANPPVSPRTGRHPSMPRLEHCGEVEAMFMYDYARHMLVVRIERAVGLALPGEPKIDPFIKVHFLRNNSVKEKRCTRYIESTNHPKWEQSFSVSVEEDDLRLYKIKMAAWNYFHPRQNTFIGAAVVDLATQHHVDGNLRMYKLDSDPGDRRDIGHGSTPLMSRGSRSGPHGNKKPHSNSMSPHPHRNEHHNSAVPQRFHSSPHQSHSLHSSPQHSPHRSSTSSNKSERSNSLRRHSNHSGNNTQSREDNYHIRQSHHLSPSHGQQQPAHLPHSSTNGISGYSQELNNNNAIKSGRGMNRAQQLRY